jgi:hypothetical protein
MHTPDPFERFMPGGELRRDIGLCLLHPVWGHQHCDYDVARGDEPACQGTQRPRMAWKKFSACCTSDGLLTVRWEWNQKYMLNFCVTQHVMRDKS